MNHSATIDAPENEDATGPCCKNCGAPQGSREPVCRRCGYYAVLGRVIELDAYDQDTPAVENKTVPTFWETWSRLLPAWSLGLMLCALGVLAESVLATQIFALGSPERTLWSLTQLGISALALALVHVLAYVSFLMQDASANLLDIVLKPVACWKPVVSKLPKTFCRVSIAVSAFAGILGSLVIIRSLNYEALLDWGIKPAAKQNLLGAVIEQAKKIEGKNEDLESALKSLEDPTADKKPVEKPRIEVDCVIVGYTVTKEDPHHFSSLVLAGEVRGKLRIVGQVYSNFPSHVREQLDRRLPQLVRGAPFVPSEIRAHWVEPVLVCRVKCVKQLPSGQLDDPLFDKLLSELQFR